MCLFPRFIKNKAYSTNKYSKYWATQDERKKYVAIGCGNCYECRRQKAQQWKVRLNEEIKVHKYAYFVTLTFSNESLQELCNTNDLNEKNVNAIATIAVRRFLERWRKKHGKSIKHWLITELGHENTERIHLHGILFNDEQITNNELQDTWKYGKTDNGKYCNEQTINYIVKYVTKIDQDHKKYKSIILCSSGLGENFVHTIAAQNTYRYIRQRSAEYYTLKNGSKVALPIYYRNKLYTEKERGELWTDRLDKATIYVNGIKIRHINTDDGQKYYYNVLHYQQRWNNELGYGNTDDEWKEEAYNVTFKMLQKAKK